MFKLFFDKHAVAEGQKLLSYIGNPGLYSTSAAAMLINAESNERLVRAAITTGIQQTVKVAQPIIDDLSKQVADATGKKQSALNIVEVVNQPPPGSVNIKAKYTLWNRQKGASESFSNYQEIKAYLQKEGLPMQYLKTDAHHNIVKVNIGHDFKRNAGYGFLNKQFIVNEDFAITKGYFKPTWFPTPQPGTAPMIITPPTTPKSPPTTPKKMATPATPTTPTTPMTPVSSPKSKKVQRRLKHGKTP